MITKPVTDNIKNTQFTTYMRPKLTSINLDIIGVIVIYTSVIIIPYILSKFNIIEYSVIDTQNRTFMILLVSLTIVLLLLKIVAEMYVVEMSILQYLTVNTFLGYLIPFKHYGYVEISHNHLVILHKYLSNMITTKTMREFFLGSTLFEFIMNEGKVSRKLHMDVFNELIHTITIINFVNNQKNQQVNLQSRTKRLICNILLMSVIIIHQMLSTYCIYNIVNHSSNTLYLIGLITLYISMLMVLLIVRNGIYQYMWHHIYSKKPLLKSIVNLFINNLKSQKTVFAVTRNLVPSVRLKDVDNLDNISIVS